MAFLLLVKLSRNHLHMKRGKAQGAGLDYGLLGSTYTKFTQTLITCMVFLIGPW